MGWENIKITREELFEKVWAQATMKVAKELGISDVGLAKICKKLNVPRPPQGYWARKNRPKPPALKPTKGITEHVISKWVEPELELTNQQKTKREEMINQEKLPENFLQVTEDDKELHPLALRTQEQLLKAATKKNITDESWVKGGTSCLDIRVSPALIHRAIQFMNALLLGMEERKMKVAIQKGQTWITVLGEKFSLCLEETSRRIDHEPTAKELKEKKENPWIRFEKYNYLPSSKLSLKIGKNSYGHRRSWSDGKKQRIEDCLNAIIVGLIDLAFAEKSRRAEKERRELERREYEKLRYEKQEAIRKEKKRLEELESNAENWHRSQKLRQYIEALCQHPNILQKEEAEDIKRWREWATQQADRLDPLTDSPPSILDEETYWCGYRY